ncbi:hypothetical protein LMG28688_03296 [Paraburkholderia caffeinitolerans]|uniref:Uncharacterized protein n=1 Tax=Paraburkholderia caffeinitolerans TaxID=1723730 RepID=A0A6J5G0T9_9BURK|nr:hypothetical protein LMG28688_03296 [Paraburkholderia caffeinitolerans]
MAPSQTPNGLVTKSDRRGALCSVLSSAADWPDTLQQQHYALQNA